MDKPQFKGSPKSDLEKEMDKNFKGSPEFSETDTSTWPHAHITVPDPVAMVSVSAAQLNELLTQLTEYKTDLIALVQVFSQFEALFSGKGSIMSIMPVITKLLSNQSKMAELANILPIIEKYTQQPANHEPKG